MKKDDPILLVFARATTARAATARTAATRRTTQRTDHAAIAVAERRHLGNLARDVPAIARWAGRGIIDFFDRAFDFKLIVALGADVLVKGHSNSKSLAANINGL